MCCALEASKEQGIIRTCLEVFTEKGLINTTSRDLSAALNLQSAGIYYYFKSKDDLVVACAEEAALQLEKGLIPLEDNLDDLDQFMRDLRKKCDLMAPKMKFLAQTFTVPQYHDKLAPLLPAAVKRYKEYAIALAEKLGRDVAELEPYVYTGISAATDYMIFGEIAYIKPQFDRIKQYLRGEK